MLATYLRDAKSRRPRRVIQVRRDETVPQGAAAALAGGLSGFGIAVEERVFDAAKPTAAIRGLAAGDILVFWLRPADLKALAKAVPKLPNAAAYFSARMSGDDLTIFPQAWRSKARLIYPYEIGEKRKKNVRTLREWLQTYGLPLVDESFQSEVFFNLLLVTDVTTQMLDNYYRDYLVERAEDMLGQGANVSTYPRLSLGANQRFASKGAYIARFDKTGALAAESEWIVP